MNRRRLLTTAFAGAAASMLRPELEAQAPAAGGWPIKPLPFDPTDNVAFGRPILVNDMFEHAYHMDYGANAAMYIDAFMQNINWDECNRRLEEAKKMYASLRG